jgi:hypothetical protein
LKAAALSRDTLERWVQRKVWEGLTRIGHRRPGTSIAFEDAPTGEVLLRVGLDEDGCPFVYFRLYDSSGCLAAESGGVKSFPSGLKIHSGDGELLLDVPAEPDAHIQYRLYNRNGELLTCSNGVSTKIQALLRMAAGGSKAPGVGTRRATGVAWSAAKTEGRSITSSS